MLNTIRSKIFLDKLGIIVAVVFLSSCYVGPGSFSSTSNDAVPHVYKLYPGKGLAESEIVTVNMTDAYYAIIDGFRVEKTDYQQVHLLPGEHKILWGKWFAFSVMVEPSMFGKGEGEAVVNLISGHTYELHADRTYGHGYTMFFWIQDAESGKVVAGTKKP